MKKNILLLTIILVCAVAVRAQQNINVASFRLDPTDLTANRDSTIVIDQNGEKCALIKVRTTQTGFSFDVGALGIMKTEQHTAEIWVYVPHGVRHITIQHQQLGTCEYQIPIPVDKARTYIMELTTGRVTTVVEDAVTEQYVVFDVTPKDALITLDGESLTPVGGTAMKLLRFGTYDYRVEMKNYHPEIGKITVSDPVNKHLINVRLKPAFGWIDIKSSPSAIGGRVYIDNELMGIVPMKTNNIASGVHRLKIVRQMYADFEQQVTVSDSQTTTIVPVLNANFTTVTLTTASDAEIWVNGEKKGTGSWTGPLQAGDYLFETRTQHHRNATLRQSIASNQSPQVITLPAPTPITGRLEITTQPAMADIVIDGEKVGQTPINLNNILIGSHKVTVSKTGYGDLNAEVEITEGNTATLGGTLSESARVAITTNIPNANIAIDGVDMGRIKPTYNLGYGSHTILLKCEGFKDRTVTIDVTPQRTTFRVDMEALFGDKTFTVRGVSFTMVAVRGGSFRMGATGGKVSHSYYDDNPAHSVTLSDYRIGQKEVTQALWRAVMGNNPSNFKGDQRPVEMVSWDNCQKFIRKLNQLTGEHFRLPTEAEWEYAARGGNRSRGYTYAGGNDIDQVAWYGGNSGGTTHDVGTKQANELGLYDMSGNVFEWCQDWYADYSTNSQTNPTGPTTGTIRVYRGGSWWHNDQYCRVSDRRYHSPVIQYYYLGFRLAL